MNPLILFCTTLLLTACAPIESAYHVHHYIGASEDNTIAQWRQREGIPSNALIAVYPDGRIAIVENPTHIRYIGPSMDTYVNDFVACYLNMDGSYLGKTVILQAPCDRDPQRFRYFGIEPESGLRPRYLFGEGLFFGF